jgi:two-component system, OmpR family, phosphate regulon response regulator PhoB
MNILLIEDSRFLRRAIEMALVKAGYHVAGAHDGEEGLRLARESTPDLILLDMMLPKVTGQNVLANLKGDPTTANIPVMVLTSLSQKNEAWMMEAGAVAYLEKSDALLAEGSATLIRAVKHALSVSTKSAPAH